MLKWKKPVDSTTSTAHDLSRVLHVPYLPVLAWARNYTKVSL